MEMMAMIVVVVVGELIYILHEWLAWRYYVCICCSVGMEWINCGDDCCDYYRVNLGV